MANSQPGLEVVVPPTDPEVASPSRSTLQNSHTPLDAPPEVVPIEYYDRSHRAEAIYPYGESAEEEAKGIPSEETSHGSASPAANFLNGRRGLLILVGIAAFVLLAVSAVVGGVLGSRDRESAPLTTGTTSMTMTATTEGTQTSSPSSPESTGAPSHPRQSSPGLAVAGWRTSNESFTFRLFYQDKDDGLRFSEYNSGGVGWGNSTKVERADVLSNTSIGANVIMQVDPRQYEMFFLNTSYLITGNNFRDGFSNIGGDFDTIDQYPLRTHSESRLVSCWPYIVLQTPNMGLSVIHWLGHGPVAWQNFSLGIDASVGTSLAILPLTRTYFGPYYNAAVVYRGPGGGFALYSLEFGGTGSELETVGIGESASSAFGAFAVARENDSDYSTNIYILYQTESNDLAYIYNRGYSWELGVSSDVLKNADPSTDIACLTQSIWEGVAEMSSSYDMSRCFFYSGGRMKHVLFNGTAWVEGEAIPYN
ncbi:hypothetical protein F5Y14DRAFT_434228 [Nemania sp. NC0429]|nr:hypothetical protein F5Y14DRAFT_434228 [Nemania sp. NC0429]